MATTASSILLPKPSGVCSRYSGVAILPQDAVSVSVSAARTSCSRHWLQLQNAVMLRNRVSRDVSARAWWSRSKASQEPQVEVSQPEIEVSKKAKKTKSGKNKQLSASEPAPPPPEEEEVEISWAQEKAEELVQLTGTAINAIPGPRVGETSMPWLLALPITYFSVTFVIAVYRTIKKINSPKAKKRRMIGTNAFLVTSLDKYFPERRQEFDNKALESLKRKCAFSSAEVLRKYIRYVLNERQFTPDAVADLIHLRKTTSLTDEEAADVLNETAKRIVKENGIVIMDLRGLTEKGVKRKAAVQSLFSKLLYLSELEDFCSTSKASLKIKEHFGVTDEDANSLRIETLSQLSDIESLENKIEEPPTDQGSSEQKAS